MATGYRVSEAPPTRDTFTPFLQQIFAQNLASEQAEDRTLASEERREQRRQQTVRERTQTAQINSAMKAYRIGRHNVPPHELQDYDKKFKDTFEGQFEEGARRTALGIKPTASADQATARFQFITKSPLTTEEMTSAKRQFYEPSFKERQKKKDRTLRDANRQVGYREALVNLIQSEQYGNMTQMQRIRKRAEVAMTFGQPKEERQAAKRELNLQTAQAAVLNAQLKRREANEVSLLRSLKERATIVDNLSGKPTTKAKHANNAKRYLAQTIDINRRKLSLFLARRQAGTIPSTAKFELDDDNGNLGNLYIKKRAEGQTPELIFVPEAPRSGKVLPYGRKTQMLRTNYIRELIEDHYRPADQWIRSNPKLHFGDAGDLITPLIPAQAQAGVSAGGLSPDTSNASPDDLPEYPEKVVLPNLGASPPQFKTDPNVPSATGIHLSPRQEENRRKLVEAFSAPAVPPGEVVPGAATAPPAAPANIVPPPDIKDQTKSFVQIVKAMEAANKESGSTASTEQITAIVRESGLNFQEMWKASANDREARSELNRLNTNYKLTSIQKQLQEESEGSVANLITAEGRARHYDSPPAPIASGDDGLGIGSQVAPLPTGVRDWGEY